VQTSNKAAKTAKVAKPVFKQYRELDGKFYFKLLDANSRLLLQSTGFDSPKEAGQTIGLLQTQGASALPGLAEKLQNIPAVETTEVSAALQLMTDAE
jgi:tryptophanyl-tRNA synthetase